MRCAKDMTTGQRHGRLRVITRSGSNPHGALWMCSCECGARVRVLGSDLRRGAVQSCGCLRREIASSGAWRYQR